eukprot:TRINITY_DN13143_c0_g13_i1.p1 TRINITY_DN13143_c0_g13~~TRINITY_DN13143_c0_g13_i1.p1  ORF type:complete len:359 (+),score=57.94 TRINITY_DN13143_c0_g13_i1:87-1163(+)
MERDMQHKSIEEQETERLFERFNEELDCFEFPKNARTKSLVVAADDSDPNHGTTNYYGTVQKRRSTTSKFHPRWIVLKGFALYWYRTSDSKEQKGCLIIGDKAPVQSVINEQRCCTISDIKGASLTFLLNGNGAVFMAKIGCQVCTKQYLQEAINNNLTFNKTILHYLNDPFTSSLHLNKYQKLNNNFIEQIAESLKFHTKLKEVELINCEITDEQLAILAKEVKEIMKLNLSSNRITQHSARIFNEIIQSPITSLILDNNSILDATLEEISHGLQERARGCLMQKLSLKNTGISDGGIMVLANLIKALGSRGRLDDIGSGLSLDVSSNDIADVGLRMLGEILEDFNVISCLNISDLP